MISFTCSPFLTVITLGLNSYRLAVTLISAPSPPPAEAAS